MAEETSQPAELAWPQRVRRAALYALFALVLVIPKLIGLRHKPAVWNPIRAGLSLLGAGLVVVPLGLWSDWFYAVVGMVLFLAGLLIGPASDQKTADQKARELGALIMVSGGHFGAVEGARARIYAAADRATVLDPQHELLVELPYNFITAIRAEPAGDGWKLVVESLGGTSEFFYSGFFAEHLARVAEDTLHSQIRHELPVLPS